MESSLTNIITWLKKSGLKVNETKTEICHFSRSDRNPIIINVNGTNVHTKSVINVLGVLFDSKLQWAAHINSAVTKANRALNAIKLIKQYFTSEELLRLVTSNFYSLLFYNSEIWHIHTIHGSLKRLLLSTSAKAIKTCLRAGDCALMSFEDIHELSGRATPQQMMNYKMSLQLYRTINLQVPTQDWVSLNLNSINTTRQTKFSTNRTNRLKVGMNQLANRLYLINNKIELDWFNHSVDTFKIKCKKLFL